MVSTQEWMYFCHFSAENSDTMADAAQNLNLKGEDEHVDMWQWSRNMLV